MIELQKLRSFVTEIRDYVSRLKSQHGIQLSPNDTRALLNCVIKFRDVVLFGKEEINVYVRSEFCQST